MIVNPFLKLFGFCQKEERDMFKRLTSVSGIGPRSALGVLGMFVMPEFPATDYMTAVAVGIVSGLAATGINQVYKQLTKEG